MENLNELSYYLKLLKDFKINPSIVVILLMNAFYYGLKYVSIIIEDGYYRLFISDFKKKCLLDRKYPTLEAALNAFEYTFTFIDKSYAAYLNSMWSIPYIPDDDWLDNILKDAENCNQA